MIAIKRADFDGIKLDLQWSLGVFGEVVDVGEWQSITREEQDLPQQKTIELQNVVFDMDIPQTMEELQAVVSPNLPFAEAQFQDRVSGAPLNPPPSDKLWPWAHHLDDDKAGGQYSHTYPERYWPKHARPTHVPALLYPRRGVRYAYGDLQDVLSLLRRSPYTRQAVLPVWFPEDTGAVQRQRVPCSIGYHFLLRKGELNVTYWIRSCDFFRHFQDDVYMTARLVQWILEEMDNGIQDDWTSVLPGKLTMHIDSLHVFEAERARLMKIA
jgi:hypothetical protein